MLTAWRRVAANPCRATQQKWNSQPHSQTVSVRGRMVYRQASSHAVQPSTIQTPVCPTFQIILRFKV
ncbi:hypothetical protein AA0313_1220 [Acetobacter indonesiensis NRIC 0313]|nr:hypothetical protein AA0313_1220 [Acetobacter indonesiensis NRIC 0313]